MFSKEESKKMRQEFWTEFGQRHTRKWMLYNTSIKEIELKFTFDTEQAQVSLDVVSADDLIRAYYYEKLLGLKNILLTEYLPDALFEENYLLPEGKTVSRVYVQLKRVNIHSRKDWDLVQKFLNDRMNLMEEFFKEYSDYIAD
ncbi:DUF4268 domain-containing protein [Gillisia sp. M10.2A]|uniref:DUF4268 domain-containing protein n=1 Tax=Gillisia lutea TaxID=2909668 RepID=A0ABS9ELT2_9FLAO|nr:DUF4268 domain-containing protein [Gillisia lutea]MCF4102765.1 DUF4268 domain-containing protein [Gillisia lutea]